MKNRLTTKKAQKLYSRSFLPCNKICKLANGTFIVNNREIGNKIVFIDEVNVYSDKHSHLVGRSKSGSPAYFYACKEHYR